ncbi:Uncaracterized surface protein containing fasciclin (FAS1) repeats, partial [Glycomyces sambucus]
GEFGAACSAVPADGEGSFTGMADDPVATAASNNPVLSTLVTAVGEADLVDTLNTAEDITVFAPTNDAFAKIPEADLNAVLADQETLTSILTYHVVPGQLAPDALAGEHTTLQGTSLSVEGSGEEFTVNGEAAVVCGNVQTANATVYIIDTVLMPA